MFRAPSPGWLPIALAVALFVAALGVAFVTLVSKDPAHFEATGRISNEALAAFGIKVDERILDGHVSGLVRATFAHLAPAHVLVNSAGLALGATLLWRLVPTPERTLSRAVAVLALAVCAASAGFFLSFLARSGPSAGASGAVFGLLGALPGAILTRSDLLPLRPRLVLAALLLALGLGAVLILAGDGSVDHAAHLGGLLTGLALGVVQAGHRGRLALTTVGALLLALAFTPP